METIWSDQPIDEVQVEGIRGIESFGNAVIKSLSHLVIGYLAYVPTFS